MDLTSLSAINGLESVSRYDKLQTIQENSDGKYMLKSDGFYCLNEDGSGD